MAYAANVGPANFGRCTSWEEHDVKLYYAETINSVKTCAVARYLPLEIEYAHVDLAKGEQYSPQYLAINPNGKAPALVDGDLQLWESNAIMCHLAMKAGSDLWPQGHDQVEILRWFNWNSEHFSRYTGTIYFENLIKPKLGFGEPDTAIVAEASGFVQKYGAVLNEHLKSRDYLVADRLTLADFAVATTLPFATEARIPIEAFDAINRWYGRLMEIPAWREPFPARQVN
nr:glutathione S-transferase family protein [Phyllobacterium sp. 21LDTY02-6]